MLKEIKKESDVITNQDLFHEIIEKVKESEKWPSNLVDYEQADNYEAGLYDKFPYGKPQTDEVARGSGTESMAVRD